MEEERLADSPAQVNSSVSLVNSSSSAKNDKAANISSTVVKFKSEFNADCIEWCPIAAFSDFFVYGTYQLQENDNHEQEWVGNIVLNQLVYDSSKCSYSRKTKSEIKVNGIFDVKWMPHLIETKLMLGAVSCDGFIQLFQMNSEETLIPVSSAKIAEDNKKPLSLDWNLENNASSVSAVVSDSSGCLNYIGVKNSHIEIERSWEAHNFEAWHASFDSIQPSIIYSGGDDNYIKVWDLRTNLSSSVMANRRHSMGVTTIQKSKLNEYLLASGSYDEHIVLWDVRNFNSSLVEKRIEGGGIWKLKWHPTLPHYLIAAAMHQGFHVIRILKSGVLKNEISYNEHNSLAYGVDWCYNENWNSISGDNLQKNIIASCSFYDNAIHVWETSLKYSVQ